MNQKRNIIMCLLLVICFLAFANTAFAKGIETKNIEPNAMLPRDKTVVVNYGSFDDIEETYYYREYSSNDEGWWTGTLRIKHIDALNGGRYRVTYEGKIYFSY